MILRSQAPSFHGGCSCGLPSLPPLSPSVFRAAVGGLPCELMSCSGRVLWALYPNTPGPTCAIQGQPGGAGQLSPGGTLNQWGIGLVEKFSALCTVGGHLWHSVCSSEYPWKRALHHGLSPIAPSCRQNDSPRDVHALTPDLGMLPFLAEEILQMD